MFVVVLFLSFLPLSCSISAPPLEQASFEPIRGIALGLFSQDYLWDYSDLIAEIASVGASDIVIVVPIPQESVRSSQPVLRIPVSHLQKIIHDAQQRKLRISLMPIIQLPHRGTGEWRGVLQPEESSIWWSNYRSILFQLAVLAQREEIERMYIGSELCSLESQKEQWSQIIKGVRMRYSGRLSYSANWDHFSDIDFWAQLDEISITEYSPVSSNTQEHWKHRLQILLDFARIQQRPVLISEYGYPSISSATQFPWDETRSTVVDLEMQARLLNDAMSVLYDSSRHPSNFLGAFYWNWFGFGGATDTGFTPRGKPAERIIRRYFSEEYKEKY